MLTVSISVAHLQDVPMDCEMEFNVEKRDDSKMVDFVVCVKNGRDSAVQFQAVFIHDLYLQVTSALQGM